MINHAECRSVSGGTAGGPPASNHDSSHTQEQLHMIQANHRPVSGHPATQQILPSQGQFRGPGQPILHSFDPNGRPLMHPIPPHPVPVFSQLHDRTGHVVGLVRRGSFSLSEPTGPGLGVRRVPPGWTQSPTHQPQVHPQMQSQARPRIPPRPIQQTPSQFNQQISSQITRQGSMPMNWSESPGPPPPYPGPIYLTPGEPTPRTNRVSRTFGTSTIPQPQTLPEEPNEGPEHDGNGLSVPPVPGRERMGNGPTRANPPRKARPKDLSELV